MRHLPICGWQPFLLVALVAEAGGGWPHPLRCISLTCLPKDDSPFFRPDKIRAIGISFHCLLYVEFNSLPASHPMDGQDIAPSFDGRTER